VTGTVTQFKHFSNNQTLNCPGKAAYLNRKTEGNPGTNPRSDCCSLIKSALFSTTQTLSYQSLLIENIKN